MGIQIGESEVAGILLFVAVLLLIKVVIAATGATFSEGPTKRVEKVVTMEAFDGGGGLRELFTRVRESHSRKSS